MRKLQLVKAGSAMLVASLICAQDPPPLPAMPGQGSGQSSDTAAAPPNPAKMIANQMVASHVSQLTTELNLNSEQQAQATSIFATENSAVFGLMNRLLMARTALQTAVENNEISVITAQARQIGTLTGQTVEAHAKAEAAFYAILSPDQKAEYRQLKPVGPAVDGPGAGATPGGLRPVGPR